MIREDAEHPEELRYDILGRVGKILFVVCAFRNRNVIRMISARLATTSEKERYEHDITKRKDHISGSSGQDP